MPGTGSGSSGGTLNFDSLWQNNRVALGLFNGSVYIGFGAHGDNGPWHGWVLVYNENTLKRTAAICSSPNGYGNGFWGSGAGFAIDTVSANGRAFLATGNGDFTSYPPLSSNVDFGESILRYDLSNGGFAISDAFTTFNQAKLTSRMDQVRAVSLFFPISPEPILTCCCRLAKRAASCSSIVTASAVTRPEAPPIPMPRRIFREH